jgi:hypothetical protein
MVRAQYHTVARRRHCPLTLYCVVESFQCQAKQSTHCAVRQRYLLSAPQCRHCCGCCCLRLFEGEHRTQLDYELYVEPDKQLSNRSSRHAKHGMLRNRAAQGSSIKNNFIIAMQGLGYQAYLTRALSAWKTSQIITQGESPRVICEKGAVHVLASLSVQQSRSQLYVLII